MSGGTPDTDQLILFVTGDAPRSRRARANLRHALEAMGASAGAREIDLVAEPEQSLQYGIFATPALVRVGGDAPLVLYGDLSEEDRLRRFLADVTGPAASA